MAGIRGLFVRKSGTVGTTTVAARKDIAGLVATTAAFGARPGVISGCVVSGTTSGWTYSVSAGHLVTVRSAADGAMPWGNDAAATVATSAAPVSGSRIDLITASHNDVDNGDADSNPVLGVTQGVAGSPGLAPALPAGAIELGRCTLPSGASNTQGGTFSAASVQYTTARGAPIPVAGGAGITAALAALDALASLTNPVVVARRDTGAQVRSIGTGFDMGGFWAAYTPVLAGTTTNPGVSAADGRYTKIGRTVEGWASFTLSSGGSGTYTVSLPETSAADGFSKRVGGGYGIDSSASNLRNECSLLLASGGGGVTMQFHGTVNSASSGIPWTWATGDIIRIDFRYEATA